MMPWIITLDLVSRPVAIAWLVHVLLYRGSRMRVLSRPRRVWHALLRRAPARRGLTLIIIGHVFAVRAAPLSARHEALALHGLLGPRSSASSGSCAPALNIWADVGTLRRFRAGVSDNLTARKHIHPVGVLQARGEHRALSSVRVRFIMTFDGRGVNWASASWPRQVRPHRAGPLPLAAGHARNLFAGIQWFLPSPAIRIDDAVIRRTQRMASNHRGDHGHYVVVCGSGTAAPDRAADHFISRPRQNGPCEDCDADRRGDASTSTMRFRLKDIRRSVAPFVTENPATGMAMSSPFRLTDLPRVR